MTDYSVLELDTLLEFSSYEEMARRPRFRVEVDSSKVKPIGILGFYPRLPEMIRCGLSGCHTPQLKGYLVLCDDETETNIGEDCGISFFGVAFSDIKIDFERRWRQKELLDRIRRGIEEASQLLTRLDALIKNSRGAAWLIKSIRNFEQTTPREIVSDLKTRAIRGENKIELPRRRTSTELAVYDSENAPAETADEQVRQRYERSEQRIYVTERVGELAGLDVFVVDGRAIIFQTLKPELLKLSILEADQMTSQQRAKWAKWLRDVEGEFLKVEAWLSSGLTFFSLPQNMMLLEQLAPDETIKAKIKNRKWDLESCAWH